MIIPDDHISVASGSDVIEVCQPLFDSSGINFFIYCRFYDDGTLYSFPSHSQWHQHFMRQEYFSSRIRMQAGMHLWASHKQYTQANIDAREYFNIDNKFEIVERGKDFYDICGFASPKGYAEINDYYINHIDYFKKFGLYFKDVLRKQIEEADKPENRLNVRHQIVGCADSSHSNINVKFIKDIKRYYVSTKETGSVYLTKREMQILLQILRQKTYLQIASELFLSHKTVEAYLANIKAKLGCRSRAELFECALESGLLHLLEKKTS